MRDNRIKPTETPMFRETDAIREVYADMRRKGHMKISYGEYVKRMMERNVAQRKQEFEERRIKTNLKLKDLL